jgi:hypothetical protein
VNALPRRRLGMPQHVLVPHNVDLATAAPDGSWDEFTDFHRWDTPGAVVGMTVQYCADHRDVAFARARTVAFQSGMAVDELAVGPGLLDVHIDSATAADLTGPVTLAGYGLPPAYPSRANEPGVRATCRAVGDTLFAAHVTMVAVHPAEAQARTLLETLVALPARTLTVTRRRTWGSW